MNEPTAIIRMRPEVKERFAHFFNDPEEANRAVRFAEERALTFWGVYSKWRDTIFASVPKRASTNGFSANIMFDISDFEVAEAVGNEEP